MTQPVPRQQAAPLDSGHRLLRTEHTVSGDLMKEKPAAWQSSVRPDLLRMPLYIHDLLYAL